jgi:protein SCO1/2
MVKRISILGIGIVIFILALDFFILRERGFFVNGRWAGFGSQTGAKPREIVYKTRGVLTEWGDIGKSAFIHHEEIEGFMKEMTMLLKVYNTNELVGVKLGDQVDFELVLSPEIGTHIRHVKPTGRNYPEQVRDSSQSLAARWAGSEIKPGDPVPAFSLTNTHGARISSQDLLGKVWAVTFMFTRCPIPEYCPLMSQRFLEASHLLAQHQQLDWHLISITMDPDFDTSTKLAEYASISQLNLSHWDFLTGPENEIRTFGEKFGLFFSTDKFPIEHNLRTAVIDENGHLIKVLSGNQWTAQDLVSAMVTKSL